MENMGEVDNIKPIDSVQTAITLFDAKSDPKKNNPTTRNGCEKEREYEEVLKDLASYKVQLEAKDATYMQALLKLEQQQKTEDKRSALLKHAEIDRDKYINKCIEASVQLYELEQKLNGMTDQCSETVKVREQLSAALSELKIEQAEVLSMETESELKGILQIELLEKEKTVDHIRDISELNETIRISKFAAIEAEKEMSAALSEKDAELKSATEKVVELQVQLDKMSNQIETTHDLERRLLAKTLYADMLELALKQTNELECPYEKASSNDLNDLKQLKAAFEVEGNGSSDQALYIEALKTERNQLKVELKDAHEEIENFKVVVETLTDRLDKMKLEMDESKERENGAQVEIALLKSELHKGRSKIAAAEARAESVKCDLYLAVRNRDLADEARDNDGIKLRQEPCKEYDETVAENTAPGIDDLQFDNLKTEASESREEVGTITITSKEYQSLIKNVDRTSVPLAEDSCHLTKCDPTDELEKLRKELEAAVIRIGEFRARAEQAVTRADMAEKAKEAVEDQLRKWREQKQKRKAAHAAMKEVSDAPRPFNPPIYERNSTVYQPLGKVLNLKF